MEDEDEENVSDFVYSDGDEEELEDIEVIKKKKMNYLVSITYILAI